MFLVQLLLPLYVNDGRRVPHERFAQLRDELTERFGGVTAFLRSPAEGAWKEGEGGVTRDDVVVYEVMTEQLERRWWADYRDQLTRRFRQDELIITATTAERL